MSCRRFAFICHLNDPFDDTSIYTYMSTASEEDG